MLPRFGDDLPPYPGHHVNEMALIVMKKAAPNKAMICLCKFYYVLQCIY